MRGGSRWRTASCLTHDAPDLDVAGQNERFHQHRLRCTGRAGRHRPAGGATVCPSRVGSFDLPDVALAWRETPASGELPVVALHGMCSTSAIWDGVAARLAEVGRSTIALDEATAKAPGQARTPARRCETTCSLSWTTAGWLRSMVSGQVDMAGAWYVRTIDSQSKGKDVIGIMPLSGAPGEREMCGTNSRVHSAADFKGKTPGVTALGSGTDELTQTHSAAEISSPTGSCRPVVPRRFTRWRRPSASTSPGSRSSIPSRTSTRWMAALNKEGLTAVTTPAGADG